MREKREGEEVNFKTRMKIRLSVLAGKMTGYLIGLVLCFAAFFIAAGAAGVALFAEVLTGMRRAISMFIVWVSVYRRAILDIMMYFMAGYLIGKYLLN